MSKKKKEPVGDVVGVIATLLLLVAFMLALLVGLCEEQ